MNSNQKEKHAVEWTQIKYCKGGISAQINDILSKENCSSWALIFNY